MAKKLFNYNRQGYKTPMPVLDPVERANTFAEVTLGYDVERAVNEARRCIQCSSKPCVAGCPVGVPVREFVAYIAQRDLPRAYAAVKDANALPAICGRVCPQESQCEGVCMRGRKGEPVGIGTEVFDNVVFRAITDEEIAQFERLRFGQDFGWYPDPWAVTGSEWRPGQRELLTFCEDGANKLPPDEQAERVKALLTWSDGEGREPP